MEIYLCHMFVYRIFEKLNILHMTGNEIVNYCLIAVATLAGAILAAFVWSKLLKVIHEHFGRK